jgi:EAL and modified HD-GYP domain-containing signal transduction protein
MIDQDKKIQDIFVARQPIFDKYQKIFGYELLFRSGLENFFDQKLDIDFASSKTLLDTLLLFGIDQLTQGKKMFLNFSKKVLLSEVALALPKEQLVIELLETIQPEPEVVTVCRKLKDNGYVLALADIIKVDFLLTKGHERKEVIRRSGDKRIKYLAEKIESYDEYKEAVDIGYTYFQGFFFCRPLIVSGKDVPSYKLNLFQALQELNQSYMDVQKIESIIMRDVSLTYKLLRFINSAAFGIPGEIRSIRQALLLLGVVEVKKWMSLIVLSQIGSDSPEELLTNSIVRAKFCETIADQTKLKYRKYDFFLMGLFSFIDIFLNRPMGEILAELPIAGDIKDALLGVPNELRQVLDLIIMYEQGNWESVAEISDKLEIGPGKILPDYLNAIKWVNDCTRVKT